MIGLIGSLARLQAASLLYVLQETEQILKGVRGGGVSASLRSEEKVVRDLLGVLEGNLDESRKELLNQFAGVQDQVRSRVERKAEDLHLKEYPDKLYESLTPTGLLNNLNKSLHYMLQKLGDLSSGGAPQAQPEDQPAAAEAKESGEDKT